MGTGLSKYVIAWIAGSATPWKGMNFVGRSQRGRRKVNVKKNNKRMKVRKKKKKRKKERKRNERKNERTKKETNIERRKKY